MASKLSRLCSFLAFLGIQSEAFCPQGFGNDQYFPEEWKIPTWPKDMDLDMAASLHMISLGGFKMASLNEEYLQGPGDDFIMQGDKTFWQASGKYFMYYCKRFDKWRIAEISAFGKNMEGNCFAFVSDAHPGRDVLNASLIKEWIEVENGEWAMRKDAGVVKIARLGDQMDTEEIEEEVETTEVDPNCDSKDGAFKDKKSSCPVMPVVRKIKKKVVQTGKAVGKWVRRLFPKYLGAPSEEDEIPEDEGGEDSGSSIPMTGRANASSCNPEAPDSCSFKEKFYVEKQKKNTPEQRIAELQRLGKMQDVVMKPEQTEWFNARLDILLKMVEADEKSAQVKPKDEI